MQGTVRSRHLSLHCNPVLDGLECGCGLPPAKQACSPSPAASLPRLRLSPALPLPKYSSPALPGCPPSSSFGSWKRSVQCGRGSLGVAWSCSWCHADSPESRAHGRALQFSPQTCDPISGKAAGALCSSSPGPAGHPLISQPCSPTTEDTHPLDTPAAAVPRSAHGAAPPPPRCQASAWPPSCGH